MLNLISDMKEDKNWFDKFSFFMDQNIRGVQYGIYFIAGLGFAIALRSVRPFAKFSVPSDIPKHFIKKKMSFIGKVSSVEPGQAVDMNPVLLVDHRPLISMSKKNINRGLPVEISSVSITSNGFIWLQSLLTNKEIKFVPLRTSSNRVYSIVYNQHQNVGYQLVKIGFATVSPIDFDLKQDNYYLKYYKDLLSAEKKAEKKGAGLWADGKVSFPKFVFQKFKSIIPFSF